MSKWSSRDGILTRHVGHALTGLDSRSVLCGDCSVTLLLDANREVAYRPPSPIEHVGVDREPIRDRYGRKPCSRCGKRVNHDSDGEPVDHARADDPYRECVRGVRQLASLPPGGWRELVRRATGGDA